MADVPLRKLYLRKHINRSETTALSQTFFRNRNTGQLQQSLQPQNIHFHLRIQCVKMKYTLFDSHMLTVPP